MSLIDLSSNCSDIINCNNPNICQPPKHKTLKRYQITVITKLLNSEQSSKGSQYS